MGNICSIIYTYTAHETCRHAQTTRGAQTIPNNGHNESKPINLLLIILVEIYMHLSV